MKNEVAIYLRKSTKDRQKNSLDVQRESMLHYIGSKPNKTFVDESTGKSLDRAGLRAAFKWLDQDKSRVLVFYKVCRYGRTIDAFESLRSYINKGQVRFMDLGSFDSPIDFTMLQLKLVFAENESRLLGDRISKTHKVLAARGQGWGASEPQLSQMRNKSIETRRTSAREWAQKAFELDSMLRKAGISFQADRVAKMNELGFTSPRGAKMTASRLSQAVSKHLFIMKQEGAQNG